MNRSKNRIISIIVPVYNVEKYLNRCITSVIMQTYRNFELILVDDGSSDNSGKICDEWGGYDDRVKVIHQKNGGVSKARNVGLEIARGEYIMFLDSDDYLEENICGNLIGELEISDSECSICGYFEVDENGEREAHVSSTKFYISGIEAMRDLYFEQKYKLRVVEVWGKLFRYQMWENRKFTEDILYEDLDIMPELYAGCKKISVIPYAGYNYLQRENSITHGRGTNNKRYMDSIVIRQKHIDFYENLEETELKIASIQALCDLIITSDKNGWIPCEEKEASKKIFNKYYMELIGHKKWDIKIILKILIYKISGNMLYKVFSR